VTTNGDPGYSPDNDVEREPWELEEARDVILKVETLVRPLGLFTSLTGGVLYRGESAKDLDLIFCQLGGETSSFPFDALREALTSLGWTLYWSVEAIRKYRQASGAPVGCTEHHVECWVTEDNQRVDVFVMRDP
jgi:hypothetical protein